MLQEESFFFLSRVCIAAALALIAACPACMQPWTATAAALSAEMMISTVLRSLGRQARRRNADDLSIHQSLTNNVSERAWRGARANCCADCRQLTHVLHNFTPTRVHRIKAISCARHRMWHIPDPVRGMLHRIKYAQDIGIIISCVSHRIEPAQDVALLHPVLCTGLRTHAPYRVPLRCHILCFAQDRARTGCGAATSCAAHRM